MRIVVLLVLLTACGESGGFGDTSTLDATTDTMGVAPDVGLDNQIADQSSADVPTDVPPDAISETSPDVACAPEQMCNGRCIDLNNDPTNCGLCGRECLPGATCSRGFCECPTGWVYCSGRCTDIRTNTQHCGRCDNVCSTNIYNTVECSAGTCVVHCRPGNIDCDRNLTNGCDADPLTDAMNCGACGIRCTGTQRCVSGMCRI